MRWPNNVQNVLWILFAICLIGLMMCWSSRSWAAFGCIFLVTVLGFGIYFGIDQYEISHIHADYNKLRLWLSDKRTHNPPATIDREINTNTLKYVTRVNEMCKRCNTTYIEGYKNMDTGSIYHVDCLKTDMYDVLRSKGMRPVK